VFTSTTEVMSLFNEFCVVFIPFQLHGVDDAIDKSKKVLTSMLRRMTRNKWIVGSVIAALVVAIIFIILFKISHH
jgi:vesicle transport through interaction with t-SNAREs protein 1